MSSIQEIQRRTRELFEFYGTRAPEPRFNEGPEPYRARVLGAAQYLLPRGHIWGGVPIHKQPEIFDVIERAVVHDRVAELKRPVGPLRELSETCPRTGRVTTKFYGSTEECWGAVQSRDAARRRLHERRQRQRQREHARAERAAAEHEMGLAFKALYAQRHAAGIRE